MSTRFTSFNRKDASGNSIPGIKFMAKKHHERGPKNARKARHEANRRARGDMNAKMSGLGSTHLQAHDPRVKEFHAFLNSMQGVPA